MALIGGLIERNEMKTLNEVIKALEFCLDYGKCLKDCPYHDDCYQYQEKNDALFYLREYRWLQDNCADTLAEKFEEQNEPLSWNELKEMKGKPVWIDTDERKYWDIISEVTNEYLFCIRRLPLHRCWQGKKDGWKAYRREKL